MLGYSFNKEKWHFNKFEPALTSFNKFEQFQTRLNEFNTF